MAKELKGRQVKCRHCGKATTSIKGYCIVWQGRNTYFCNEDEYKLWKIDTDKQLEETGYWDECYKFIKFKVMNYDDCMDLPKYLITRLQDLRNGYTVEAVTFKKIKKSKDGYPYQAITATFKSQLENIMYWFRNKSFKNENQKINYMMAIVENNINDEYIKFKTQKSLENNSSTNGLKIDDINIQAVEQNAVTNVQKTEKKKPSLLDFLTEDEL